MMFLIIVGKKLFFELIISIQYFNCVFLGFIQISRIYKDFNDND